MTTKEKKQLDVASAVVDDLYEGCREAAMDKFVHSGLLKQELDRSEEFKFAWNSKNKCSKEIPGGIKEHRSALSAYANGNRAFQVEFDEAVKTMGGNLSIYDNKFNFKSLHFLLMDSLTLLKPTKCKILFAFREEYTAVENSTVRFDQFNVLYSSFDELQDAEDLADMVVLNITSCFFVDLKDYICSVDHPTLISPAESFTVEEISQRTDRNMDTYTMYILKHSELRSFHNCYSFSR